MTKSEMVCAAALDRGELRHIRGHWQFKGRAFNHTTVNRLIARGLARRDGDRVVGTKPGSGSQ